MHFFSARWQHCVQSATNWNRIKRARSMIGIEFAFDPRSSPMALPWQIPAPSAL
jgi:hypothetical protein